MHRRLIGYSGFMKRVGTACGLVFVVLLMLAPTAPAASVSVVTEPSLYPGFSRQVKDYAARCARGEPVRVSVDAPEGVRVSVDGGRSRSGAFERRVDVRVGERFPVTVSSRRKVTRHHVRCLPKSFPTWTAKRSGRPEAEWYIVTPATSPYVAIFDRHGVPVWWMRTEPHLPIDAKLLPNGHLAWSRYFGGSFGVSPDGAYEERRLDGTLVRTLKTVGTPTDPHDMLLLPNGNYLLLSYRARDGVDLEPYGGPSNATVLDAEIQEVTPGGELVWSWNSKDHIGLSETRDWSALLARPAQLPDGRTAYDHVHINSVELDGRRIVFSARNVDAIYAFRVATGEIAWKLGGTQTPKSLDLLGDDAYKDTSFGGQHDARVLSDGTVTLQDNGSGRDRPPRALRFAIDRRARTATLLEQVTDPEAPASVCCGNARKLPRGHWVVSWGGLPLVAEYAPSGRRIMSLKLSNMSYRVVPVLPGTLARAALRAGMDAMHPR